ncbi:DNA-dependent RNA polymerase subunit RPO30 [Cotia virus SPAn232]|uniref:DNA-directed RNA polymerase 30 kDa polypeptide n=2 Tax=Cotia virus TaxID=39444 RepID=H6TA29_9POXV|nr:DNA-dependent RNA polymerase subunit RPO30 [Cotia virus SPAn232]ADT91069.1 DNA-dependent RNA polymerase subunit RPO30 [Cotia virus SPAn232]AIT70667.1 DNA-dependent RNA polymerase subunit RPO30 [Cotia virus]
MSNKDIKDILNKYITDKNDAELLLKWAIDKSSKYYIKNIVNTKINIEETKFDPKYNIGIEYSKDSKNKLSYRNKPQIELDTEYKDINNMIMLSNGVEKDTLRYILFGIKCLQKGIEYNIDNIKDIDYTNKYFNVLDTKHNTQCPQCKGRNTMPIMIQTRAADEPPLVRQTCKDCNIHFKPPRFRNIEDININRKMNKEDTNDDAPSPSDSDD